MPYYTFDAPTIVGLSESAPTEGIIIGVIKFPVKLNLIVYCNVAPLVGVKPKLVLSSSDQ